MIIRANSKFPAITAQNVGREVWSNRQPVVRIIGDRQTLQRIAWIFQRVPDMFEVRFDYASLVVRRARPPLQPFRPARQLSRKMAVAG